MENFSRDLLEQDGRREFIAEFLNMFTEGTMSDIRQLEWLARTPLMGPGRSILNRRQKQNLYGQVVPIEEIEQILGQVEGVIHLPCVCRRVTTGDMNARFCYGLILDERLSAALDDSFSLEILSKSEAITAIQKLDKDGLVHSVWTFKTPYIGGICNCDQDCMVYLVTHAQGYYPVMFRGEYVSAVDLDTCNGCKNCMRQCQYGAIRFSATNKKVVIDTRTCYGCGFCRSACHHDAIALHARLDDPVAANIW